MGPWPGFVARSSSWQRRTSVPLHLEIQWDHTLVNRQRAERVRQEKPRLEFYRYDWSLNDASERAD